jgi:hypothetical protein
MLCPCISSFLPLFSILQPGCLRYLILLLLRMPVILVNSYLQKILTHLTSTLKHSPLWSLGRYVLLVYLSPHYFPSACLVYLTAQCWSSIVTQSSVLVSLSVYALFCFPSSSNPLSFLYYFFKGSTHFTAPHNSLLLVALYSTCFLHLQCQSSLCEHLGLWSLS